MHRPLRGWHAPGHGAGGRTRGRALRAGRAPPVFGLVLTPTPRGPPRPCPTHTLGRDHYAQVLAATRFDLHFKNTPGSTWGPRRTAPPRHRGTTSLGTLGLPQVTQQQQWLQAQKPHEGSPDNTPRPPGRDLGTLWPPQPAGHSRRPPLPQGPRLWPRTHTQTAPTPVKPTSSSNSGWAWQRRAPAPFSSRQEGELSGNGGRPSQYLRTSSRGLACEEPAQHWGVEAARPGVGRGSGPGHSGPDVAVPRPGVRGLLHATVPPRCPVQGTVPGQLCSSSDTRDNRRLTTRGLGTGTRLAPAVHTECPSSQSSWTLGATRPHG